jgi:hypothetical protein
MSKIEPPWEKVPRLDLAIIIATTSHSGQLDKVGLPYILHPLYVMLQMKTEPERVIAVLHDVLEDCPQVSISDITDRIDMTEEEIGALIALTHIKNEPYVDYLKRVLAAGKIAVNVKWEDVKHNSSFARTKDLPPETVARLEKKYKIATEMLWGWKMNLKCALGISRAQAGDKSRILVTLKDLNSGVQFVRGLMELEDLSMVITGQEVKISCDLNLENVGKTREIKYEMVNTRGCYSPEGLSKIWPVEVQSFEIDGWRGKEYDYLNGENGEGNTRKVRFERWV